MEHPPASPTELVLVVEVHFSNPLEEYGPSFAFELEGVSADPSNANDLIHLWGWATAETQPPGHWMSGQAVVITPDGLPQNVSHDPRTFSWTVRICDIGQWRTLQDTTVPFWVTWEYPYSGNPGITAKRIDWVTDKAKGCESEQEVADAIWNALGGQAPPYEIDHQGAQTQVSDWRLLIPDDPNQNPPIVSPYFGKCNDEANVMMLALWMLGVPSEVRLVRASDKDGDPPYDCLDYEHRSCAVHHPDELPDERLLLDFGGQGNWQDMNQFESCCCVNSTYYAVWPKLAAANDYLILYALHNSLGVTQHYCWYDSEIHWWHPCDQQGSTPDIP